MLSTLLGLGGMAGLNLGSAFLNHSFNKEMQDDAQAHQIKMMRNAHQWEVKDLRDAGLNPILSAGGSPGSYGSSAVSSGGADLGKGVVSAIEEAQELENDTKKKEADLLEEQKNAQKSQADLNSALAKKADAETKTLGFEGVVNEKGKNFLEKVGNVSSAIGKNIGDKLFNDKKRLDYDSVITDHDRQKLNRRLDELDKEDRARNPHLYEKNSGVYIRNGNSWTGSYVDKNGDVTRSYQTKRP